ncbi:MAG: polyisoprenyl-teichoic acid--peptidoglycan teichoic acid transferase [Chloroflexota bacterium]|jgi:LCP family protein required for cell wall assembly|nr:polyisoprenyl-teichoic acid--peptidoglycan teichoic acid transferase [Chloroflexota bacterium]
MATYCTYVVLGFAVGASVMLPGLRATLAHADSTDVGLSPISLPFLDGFGSGKTAVIQAVSPWSHVPEWSGTDRINILLMGIDQRPDERERGDPTRSDSDIIVTIDPVHRTATLFSLPRDLWVQIPLPNSAFNAKLTTANFYGDYYKYPGGGVALMRATIERNIGVHVDYYARVNFDGFRQIVNTVDGIDVCVPRTLIDNEYPTDDYGIKRVVIPAGPQHFDGETALEYARSRHADSDFGRMHRQQQVLTAIRARGTRLDMLLHLPQLLTQLSDAVETDIPFSDVLSLARLATEIQPQDIGSRVIEGDAVSDYIAPDGEQAILPNRASLQRLVAQVFYDPRTVDPHEQAASATAAATAATAAAAPSAPALAASTAPAVATTAPSAASASADTVAAAPTAPGC